MSLIGTVQKIKSLAGIEPQPCQCKVKSETTRLLMYIGSGVICYFISTTDNDQISIFI